MLERGMLSMTRIDTTPNYWMTASALSYIYPLQLACSRGQWANAGVFLYLLLCSLWFHSTKGGVAYWLDQTAIITLVYRMALEGLRCDPLTLVEVTMTIAGCLTMDIYGRRGQTFIWSSHKGIRTVSHMAIHIVSAYVSGRVVKGLPAIEG